MPNYSDILRSLAEEPPQSPAQQRLHASLLELMASCLRAENSADDDAETRTESLAAQLSRRTSH